MMPLIGDLVQGRMRLTLTARYKKDNLFIPHVLRVASLDVILRAEFQITQCP